MGGVMGNLRNVWGGRAAQRASQYPWRQRLEEGQKEKVSVRGGRLQVLRTSPMTESRCKGRGGYKGDTPPNFGATGWGDSNAGTKKVMATKRAKAERRWQEPKKKKRSNGRKKKKRQKITKCLRVGSIWRASQKALELALWTIGGPLFGLHIGTVSDNRLIYLLLSKSSWMFWPFFLYYKLYYCTTPVVQIPGAHWTPPTPCPNYQKNVTTSTVSGLRVISTDLCAVFLEEPSTRYVTCLVCSCLPFCTPNLHVEPPPPGRYRFVGYGG